MCLLGAMLSGKPLGAIHAFKRSDQQKDLKNPFTMNNIVTFFIYTRKIQLVKNYANKNIVEIGCGFFDKFDLQSLNDYRFF